jgi:hypothetical protein
MSVGCVPDSSSPARRSDCEPGVYLPQELFDAFTQAGRIEYIPDPPDTDTWQTPAETRRRGAGDCEDICIYLQHLLAEEGMAAEVVFGLRDATATNGHAWLEADIQGRRWIIEPRSIAMFDRDKLPEFMYIAVDDLDVVAEKVRAYHARTGIYVNSRYGAFLRRQP